MFNSQLIHLTNLEKIEDFTGWLEGRIEEKTKARDLSENQHHKGILKAEIAEARMIYEKLHEVVTGHGVLKQA